MNFIFEVGGRVLTKVMFVHNTKQLKSLFGSNIWVNVIYLATFVVLGLMLDVIEFGAFRVTQVYLTVAVSIAMLGLNIAVVHQFPLFNLEQRVSAWKWIRRILFLTSICTGIGVYVLAPSSGGNGNSVQEMAYFLSFPAAVIGAALSNVFLSVYQAEADLKGYARFQAQWKTLVFIFALGGALFLQAQTVFIAMALAYVALFFLQHQNTQTLLSASKESKVVLTDIRFRLIRYGIWPFASICVSMIYSNIEFLYVDAEEVNSGVAGAYSLASLIFVGGAAFFMPLQTYAGSLVANHKINLNGLLKIQLACFAAVCLTSLLALGIAYGLFFFNSLKFNHVFFDFAILVSIKLALWGSYAVVGSVLNYVEKGLESFVLTVICLMGLGLGSSLVGGVDTLREIVVIQIASNFILMLGCMYLIVVGFNGRPIR